MRPDRLGALAIATVLAAGAAFAQTSKTPAEGEAFVTRFSGTTVPASEAAVSVLDVGGVVGSLVDLRAPAGPPRGQHWPDPPHGVAVTAAEVGQVFGIAFDDADPPNIYLSATSAFGLHRRGDGWMAGMWGKGGGPGTVWKLDAAAGYTPQAFASIRLDGRDNTGAALGNIAYDRWHRQLYVSDLETGMIHRLRVADGADLGRYDHGIQGRRSFVDAETGRRASLDTAAFDRAGAAAVTDCPAGAFGRHPECWNVADFRRRVWGLGVRHDAVAGRVRLYYAVWSRHDLGRPAPKQVADAERRNTVWSVGIASGGGFDLTDVRREFVLPAFGVDLAGRPHAPPVTDIAFPRHGNADVMLLAERGGLRNLGLRARAPFATPHRARVLRYMLDATGRWRPEGRYDVGFYDRNRLEPPYVRSNAAGGVDFGFAHGDDGALDPNRPDAFVWITGDALCSRDGPCVDPESGKRSNETEVHGLQGIPLAAVGELVPPAALEPYPLTGEATPPVGLNRSYVIDINPDGPGGLNRNDATKIGDVEVYTVPPPIAPDTAVTPPPPPGPQPPGAMPPGVGGITPPPPPAPPPTAPPPPPPGPPPTPPPGPAPAAAAADPGQGGLPDTGGPLSRAFDLAIEKSLSHTGIAGPNVTAIQACDPNTPCRFTITITNAGGLTYTGPLIVRDELPTGWKLVNWSGPTVCEQQGQVVSCSMAPQATLVANQSVEWKLELETAASQTDQMTQVENCAEIDWKGGPGDMYKANDRGCVTVSLPPAEPDLRIAKTGDPECRRGQVCGFTITIRNVGKGSFQGRLDIEDKLITGAKDGAKYASFASLQGWTCGPKPAGGKLVTLVACGNPDLRIDAGGAATLNISMLISNDLPAEIDALDNCASITGTLKKNCYRVPIKPEWDLRVRKSGPTLCVRETSCKFQIYVSNDGSVAYKGPIDFDDVLDFAGGKIKEVSSQGPWQCDLAGAGNTGQQETKIACRHPSITLPATKFLAPITLDVSLPVPDTIPASKSTIENCATVKYKGGKPDADASNDSQCVTAFLSPVGLSASVGQGILPSPAAEPEGPDVIVRKTKGTSICEPGDECHFVISVEGLHRDPFDRPFQIVDVLPKRWTFAGGGKLKLWSCDSQGDWTVCTYDAAKNPNLPAGGFTAGGKTLGLGIRMTVPANQKEGTITNCAFLEFPPGVVKDQTSSNYRGCTAVEIAHASKLTIEKSFDKSVCVVGEECNFTIKVGNQGKGTYDGFLNLSDGRSAPGLGEWDPLDPALVIDSITGKDWKCLFERGREPKCLSKRDLEPGEIMILEGKARIRRNAKTGELQNCAELGLLNPDPSWLTFEEKVDYMQAFLENEGYDFSKAGNIYGAVDKAIRDYKKKNPIFTDAKGNVDLSGEITDQFLKATVLPTVKDAMLKADPLSSDIASCDRVYVANPGLVIEKGEGYPETPAARVPGPASTGMCEIWGVDDCVFPITVSGSSDIPYRDPIKIVDQLPPGWAMTNYAPKGPKAWRCTGANRVVCTHPPANLKKGLSLSLRIHARTMQTGPERHPWILNCARVEYADKQQYLTQERKEYESCYKQRITHSDTNLYDYNASGSGNCLPPNCSFYEFTAKRKHFAYQGPLSMRITPPPGSSFPEARITKSGPACAAEEWSCVQTGREFGNALECRISDCALAAGEELTLRIDGNAAPDLVEPPAEELKKTACGVLEWQRETVVRGIEQRVGTTTKEACHTITVLSKPKEPPVEIDLGLTKTTSGACTAGGDCRFRLGVTNNGTQAFTGTLTIRDAASVPGMRLAKTEDGLVCEQDGETLSCIVPHLTLAPGTSREFGLQTVLPAAAEGERLENCAELVWPLRPEHDRFTRGEIRMVQLALNRAGYAAGPMDGIIGPKTRGAIAEARSVMRLAPGSALDRDFISRLLGRPSAGSTDPNPANDKACVTIDLAAPEPEPIACGPGFVVIEDQCVCPAPRVVRDNVCTFVARPAPPPVACAPGFVPAGGRCVCPAPRIVSGNACVCPPQWPIWTGSWCVAPTPPTYYPPPPQPEQRAPSLQRYFDLIPQILPRPDQRPSPPSRPAPAAPTPHPDPTPETTPSPALRPPLMAPTEHLQVVPLPGLHIVCPTGTVWVPARSRCERPLR